jgi:hypothetical protein
VFFGLNSKKGKKMKRKNLTEDKMENIETDPRFVYGFFDEDDEIDDFDEKRLMCFDTRDDIW